MRSNTSPAHGSSVSSGDVTRHSASPLPTICTSHIPSPNSSPRPLKVSKKPVVHKAFEEQFHATITSPCDSAFSNFALGLREEFTLPKPLERGELANKSVCTCGKHPGDFIAKLELDCNKVDKLCKIPAL